MLKMLAVATSLAAGNAIAADMATLTQSAHVAMPVSRDGRQAILDAARSSIASKLRKAVKFNIHELRSDGHWAFLSAQMRGPDGGPFSYAGTSEAEAASHGLKSFEYAALVREKAGTWTITDERVGPTDVPWVGWSKQYGVPADIFPDYKGMPQQLASCRTSFVSLVGPRLEGMPESGAVVVYQDGGRQVSYDQIPAIAASKVGDQVWLCLASVPKNCPKGDDRGKIYDTLNLRTGSKWKLPSSAHTCGGA